MQQLPPSLWKAVSRRAGQQGPPRTADEVKRWLETADRHRLVPFITSDSDMPAAVRDEAARLNEESAARRESEVHAETALLDWLRANLKCRWFVMKGADYRERFYDSAAIRPMHDTDILVHRDDGAAAVHLLVQNGFEILPQRSSVNETALRAPSGLYLDVYDRFAHDRRVDIDYDEIWSQVETTASGFRRMAPQHAVTTHTLILANIQFTTHFRKFLDLWLFSRNPAVMEQALSYARRWSVRRSFFVAFRILRSLFPETADDAFAKGVDELVSERERRALEPIIGSAPFDELPSRPVQIWRKFLLLDSPRHRITFFAAHVSWALRLRRNAAEEIHVSSRAEI